ncbi:hypothetical protein M422DRAFT_33147 [Sphaerobolus stellatus SS14]|uniref:Uncharacterized protein n=1 Tax=Sphaerobolus stellatus (strain SS14) TaxID=990650 RepID=A0A0C9TQH9_SPHS4|nr:hypothetical protein M422DRAFT_39259 [Sphaerobolus stellatus SS14]KIJ38752.1 hypothetical protein M422DRAFT_33147 [Sphaerobolus stellatus SS14]
MPSEVTQPTRSDSTPQQASTQPGDGARAHNEEDKVPWKDEVIGYAKVTRGKLLGKKDTVEMGHQILEGEVKPKETHKD